VKCKNKKRLATTLTITVLTILTLASHASPNSQTHTLDTSQLHFKLDNNARLKFGDDLIYLGDSNGLWSWIDTDTIQFYNLKMAGSSCPHSWKIKLHPSSNVTVTKLFENDELDLSISASSGTTTTTEVFCGVKGKPKSVNGVNSWDWNSGTSTVTLTVNHASSHDVQILWGGSASGLFTLTVSILKDGYPAHASICINNENHTAFGLTQIQLPYGTYQITSYCEGETQTKQVGIYADTTIGFSYQSPPLPTNPWPIAIPFLIIVIAAIFFLFKKKR